MPRPTSATAALRPELGVIAYEYMLEAAQRGFIGLQVLPLMEVPLQSSYYPYIPIESLLKMPDTKRAARGNYNRSDWEFGTKNFSCKENGWEELIDDNERALFSRFFDAEVVATQRAVDIVLRAQEKRIADAVMSTGNITATSNVGTEWSTVATCTPYADIKTAKAAMRAASGLLPNAVIMTWVAAENVLASTELRNKLQYTTPIEFMSDQQKYQVLANYFGVGRCLVGNGIYDSAKKGKTKTLTDIWDDEYVLLAVLSSGGQDLKEPCLGRTFLWTGDSPSNVVTETYRDEPKRSDVVRVRHDTDEAFVFAGAGYLLGNITA